MKRAAALRLVARPVLLLVWSYLAWGHLVLASTLVNAAGQGPRAAWERLLPAHGASLWGWLNAFSAFLTASVWAVAGVYLWMRRSHRGKELSAGGP